MQEILSPEEPSKPELLELFRTQTVTEPNRGHTAFYYFGVDGKM